MTFNSLSYFLFLPIIALIYYVVPRRFQPHILLIGSVSFYLFNMPAMLPLLIVGSVVAFIFAKLSENSTGSKRKVFTATGVIAFVGCLAFFKYFNTLNRLITPESSFSLIMPLGISFYSFTSIAYLVDVSRGKVKAEKSFFDLFLFLSFFGTISSGPILRANDFLPQVKQAHNFNKQASIHGLLSIALGLFYKVAIADLLAVYVNPIFSSPTLYTGLTLIAGIMMFACQLYFDFAGYSLLALGTAEIFGIDIIRNFRTPYFATSLKDFWSRWHISLSTWFRDYVYIPLGGNKKGLARKNLNIVITFVLSGLWHGSGIGFVIWGLCNGITQVLGDLTKPTRDKMYIAVKINPVGKFRSVIMWAVTACLLFLFFIPFRSASLSDGYYILTHLFTDLSVASFFADAGTILAVSFNPLPLLYTAFFAFTAITLICGICFDAITRYCTNGDPIEFLTKQRAFPRRLFYLILSGMIFAGYILNNGYFSTAVNFIYNNF